MVGLALGMKIGAFGPLSMAVALLAIVGISLIFSTIFIVLGMVIKIQEAFMGMNILLMMPLVLISGAVLPLGMMMGEGVLWTTLMSLAKCNPLTWASDAMRMAFLSESALHPFGYAFPSLLAMPNLPMGMDILLLMLTAVAIMILGMILSDRILTPK
jgi:ABC-2 type transport system permease protein